MVEIKVFTSPDSVCYTFVFFSILSVFGGYVATEPQIEITLKVIGLLGLFGILTGLILACKFISVIATRMDKFFENDK